MTTVNEPAEDSWDEAVTGWTGWIAFASTMLILIGTFHALEGLVGLFRDGYFVAPKDSLLVKVDYTAWGAVHLVLGLVAIGVGIGMALGQLWARILGVVFALVSAVVNLAFLNAYPVWSILLISFDVIVIWALTVHGAEMKLRRNPTM